MINFLIDFIASRVWGIDDGHRRLCIDDIEIIDDQKCYKSYGEYWCEDKEVEKKIRHCIEVQHFSAITFWYDWERLKQKITNSAR